MPTECKLVAVGQYAVAYLRRNIVVIVVVVANNDNDNDISDKTVLREVEIDYTAVVVQLLWL